MKKLYKKISLEALKCRIPNTLPSFSGDVMLNPSMTNFYYEFSNGNYGAMPCDVKIPREYLSGITDTTSISIVVDINKDDEYITEYDTNKIALMEDKFLSYKKLHKWYCFYKKYFDLLNRTSCEKSDKKYFSAVDYYYNTNIPKEEYETLEYFQGLDNLFVSRGGIIESGNTHCDLYNWMRDYIFLSYDIKTSKVKKYAKEWKTTNLNILSLFYWFGKFKVWFQKYGDDDCIDFAIDDDNTTDCCECNEYKRLGGSEMYIFLKECIDDYYEKANSIKDYATYRATINIPLTIKAEDNSIGEQAPLVEEWEGGVDFSPVTGEYGTIIKFGGTHYLYNSEKEAKDDNPNALVTFEDSTYISESGNTKGYIYNGYKEFSFLEDTVPIYKEYFGEYIRQNKNNENFEYKLKDLINVSSYAFVNGKMTPNPNIENMSNVYDIIKPNNDGHLYIINNKLYESFKTFVLCDKNNQLIYDGYNPVIIEFINDDINTIPYFIYKGEKFYGYYDANATNKYKFTIKRNPTPKDWLYIYKEKKEYIKYNDYFIEVSLDDSVIIKVNDVNNRYLPIDGCLFRGDSIIAIQKDKCGIVTATDYYDDEISSYTNYEFAEDDTIFGDSVDEIKWEMQNENENAKEGYLIKDNKLFHIRPFKIHKLGYVTGSTSSKIHLLEDFNKTYDKQGNEVLGKWHREENSVIPNKKSDIFDIPYHIGNTSNLSVLEQENGKGYYWGDIISNISFYFTDENNDIIESTIVSSTTPNNIDALMLSVKEYVKVTSADKEPIEGDLLYDNDVISLYTEVTWETDENYDKEPMVKTMELQYIDEIMEFIDKKPCCRIEYNIGGIIERPYEIIDGKFHYQEYKISDAYHKGIEYSEDFYVELKKQQYYLSKTSFIEVKYLSLKPIKTIYYNMDERVEDEEQTFTANIAKIKFENIYNLSEQENYDLVKFTTELNNSESDGRQFNFYNGLMYAPTITEEYNLGITSLRSVKDNIYINRGINYAYDKHLKLLEIKSFEALTQYGNGAYNIINNG